MIFDVRLADDAAGKTHKPPARSTRPFRGVDACSPWFSGRPWLSDAPLDEEAWRITACRHFLTKATIHC